MTLGIMQPYFFPYIGYYSLIKHTDQWIVFDPVQFIRHGWIERNRILKPVDGWQYIGVPLQKASRDTLIKDTKIRVKEEWRDKIFRQLLHYKNAPHYEDVTKLMHEGMNIETDSIVNLNFNILAKTCAYLQIPFKATIFSEMNLAIEPVEYAGQWALNICKAVAATEYINPYGGVEIFKKDEFDAAGISIRFMKNNLESYSQQRLLFEAGLSIIDVLMFNDIEKTNKLIDSFSFENS